MKKVTCIILISFLALLFAFLFTQQQFNFIKIKPLDGYFVSAKLQKFSCKKWFSCQYQEETERYLNDNFGFRSFFVRLNHQISFSLFNKAKTAWVTIGKHNYLYEENYIKAVYGKDFVGEDSIRNRMYKLKAIEDHLALYNKNIIWVLAAGKGSFYSEYIPVNYYSSRGVTNEEIYLKYSDSLGINHIDFNTFFKEQKSQSPYPLYPQYGIHWSYYGACLAADSIVHYIEKLCHITMPHLYWDTVEACYPRYLDRDIAKSLNLLFNPHTFNMGYPKVKFEADIGKTKPSLLVIADSFFFPMYRDFNISILFSKCSFWYYNEQAYPEDVPVKNFNFKEEINKYDVILILGTNATLPNLGWGFIEQFYESLQSF